jgi:hypothetical protein
VNQITTVVPDEEEHIERPKPDVYTTKRFAAQIPLSWLERNVRHVWLPTGVGFRQR